MDASRAEVFEAWTDAEGMSEWMCPGDVVGAQATLDVRVGGKFRIVMRRPGEEIVHTGVYRVVERPSKLVFTWIAAGLPETLVTVELFERGEQCEMVLTHEHFPGTDVADRYRNGWGRIAELLSGYLTT
jgi:uncharacterized protein YndB with AHSA1/START domain